MICEICKETKKLEELYGKGRFRNVGHPKPERRKLKFEEYKEPLTPFKICRLCWPDTPQKWAFDKYRRMTYALTDTDILPYTFKEFWSWLQVQPRFKELWRVYKRKDGLGICRAAVDRIDNNIGYELHNLQVISVSENSSKNDSEVFTAFRVSMRFFKKLRKERSLTKYEMARKLGILPQTYYYLEEKARGCSFEVLCLVHDKLGISWDDIGKMIQNEVSVNAKDNKGLVEG